jgi:hypothetical protein
MLGKATINTEVFKISSRNDNVLGSGNLIRNNAPR